MAELIVDLFLSVDGYARGTRSPAYFGYDGPDLERWIREQKERPQRHVMGRKTYQALAALPAAVRDEGWHAMVNTPTVLFSRTLRRTDWPQVTICAGDLTAAIGKLKADGTDMRTIGSLSLVRQLLAAGLVDRLRLMTFPLLIGGTGVEPAFAPLPDIGLDLAHQAVLDNRILLTEYRPAGTPPYAD